MWDPRSIDKGCECALRRPHGKLYREVPVGVWWEFNQAIVRDGGNRFYSRPHSLHTSILSGRSPTSSTQIETWLAHNFNAWHIPWLSGHNRERLTLSSRVSLDPSPTRPVIPHHPTNCLRPGLVFSGAFTRSTLQSSRRAKEIEGEHRYCSSTSGRRGSSTIRLDQCLMPFLGSLVRTLFNETQEAQRNDRIHSEPIVLKKVA